MKLALPAASRRRACRCALAGLLAAGMAVAFAESLPQRNLRVEMRQVQEEASTASRAGGSVVVHSDGRVEGAAVGSVTTRSRDAAGSSVQQLLVFNGSRGALRLARATPLQFFQVTLTPRGVEATPATLWHESGTGFVVQPRWPGGTRPVTVELSAEAGDAGVLTTVQLPLNEWVTVARSAEGAGGGSLVTSTRDADAGRDFALQLRVSVP